MSSPLPLVSAVIYAKDAQRPARFYEAALALSRADEGPGFVVLASGGLELNVVQAPVAIAAAIALTDPPEVREATPVKLSFLVSDMERAQVAVRGLGGGLKAGVAAWSWRGVLHLDAFDPEGNVFQLRQAGG